MNIVGVLSGKRKCLLAIAIAFSTFGNAQLVTYPEGLNTGMPHNDDYTVKVREAGGEWKDVFEYEVQVDMDRVQSASMVQFDIGSPVEVMVKKNNGTIQDVKIRPLAIGIQHTVNPNPLETETYTESSDKVMYFGPGVHRPKDLPNTQIQIPSNTTVYLAPGAVVKAKLLIDKAENVRIVGRGILDHPIRGIEVTHSKNIWIDGITVINPDHYTVFGGESTGLTINNLKSFSCKGWSDGIDLMCCSDVLIDNVFMRNSDDCIAIYAHRWNYYGGSRNVTLQNSILWADIAHPINIGGHGNPDDKAGEILENITVRNVDILEHDEDDLLYQGCMAVDCGDKNLVRKALFEDIRVENIQEGRLFHINVRFNSKYDKQPGRGIEDIIFRNIIYNGVGENPSLLKGFDKERSVKNIIFDNVIINGMKMKNIDDFITNEYIKNITVK